jgi:hypothetical protein
LILSSGFPVKSAIAAIGIPKLLAGPFSQYQSIKDDTQKCVDMKYSRYGFALRHAQNRWNMLGPAALAMADMNFQAVLIESVFNKIHRRPKE